MEPWRAPNLSRPFAGERTQGQRGAELVEVHGFGSKFMGRQCRSPSWAALPTSTPRGACHLSEVRETPDTLWEGRRRTPNVPQLGPRASGSDTPGGHVKFGPGADSAAGPVPQWVSWLGPAPTSTCPQQTSPPHSGSFQETVTSSPRPRFPLTGCTSGCDSQRWISAWALHLAWGAQSPEPATCPPGRGNGGCCLISSR